MHYNWGNYLNEINRKSEAAAAYEMALKLYPMYVGAMNNLATILETEPNAKVTQCLLIRDRVLTWNVTCLFLAKIKEAVWNCANSQIFNFLTVLGWFSN